MCVNTYLGRPCRDRLLVKRRFPSVSMAPVLVSVQAMELAWVGLNYLGIERTTTEAAVPGPELYLSGRPLLLVTVI